VVVVISIAYHQHSLLFPLFIGMSASIKGLFKLITPKFLVLLFKNSLFLKIKQLIIRSSTRFVVLSHKPWRHRIRWFRSSLSNRILRIIAYYMQLPLWLKQLVFGNRVAYYSAGDSELVKKDDLHHSESTRHNKTAQRYMEICYTGRSATQVVYAL